MLVFGCLSGGECGGSSGFLLPFGGPPTARRGAEGRAKIVDERLLIGEVDEFLVMDAEDGGDES